MYVEEDDYEVVTPYQQWDDRKYFVPKDDGTYDPDDPDPTPPAPGTVVVNPETGCAAQTLSESRCARITDPKRCYLTDGCWWDIEFQECYPVRTVLQYLQYTVFLLPIVYAVCYYGYAKPKLDAVWAPYEMFHGVYLGSVFFATCAFLYVGFRVMRSDAYADVRKRYVRPAYALLAGAFLTPVALALWADRGYSIYWVFLCLFLTTWATVWLVYVHLSTAAPRRRKDRVTVAAVYYALFHVLLMDNFVWWWLLFSGEG